MATGPATRFPTRNSDGTISVERTIRDENGNFTKITQTIFDAESPTIPVDFAEEIVALIENGDIEFPTSINDHIVNISDQLELGKFTYLIVDSNGASKNSSDTFRVFLNGLNVTLDVEVSEDRDSFTFSNEYSSDDFDPTQCLIIDFKEEAS